MFVESTLLIIALKLLLIPAYHSTDFEVHRNWLAITHSLPVQKWYFESTSEWTLDYPPLFAWFEFFLSQFAKIFDPEMLVVSNLNYASERTVMFQRLSVIVSDLIFAYGACLCSCRFEKIFQYRIFLYTLLIGNVGLIMVDHIHFQYNGFLFGLLLISIGNMVQGYALNSAFWFISLVCFKHIFAYVAPVYFIYLLRHYCFTESSKSGRVNWSSFSLKNFCQLGVIVMGVLVFTFVPFVDHIPQILSRLFPFKRGLCHAYWAPNFWALYNMLDKLLVVILRKLGRNFDGRSAVMTGGLVQEFSHSVLPTITPDVTLVCTMAALVPILIHLWRLPRDHKAVHFIRAIVLSAGASFLFGWHVHEKAILMMIIPLCLLVTTSERDASVYLFLSVVGSYSLFPLLFPKNLLWIKVLLLALSSAHTTYVLNLIYHPPNRLCYRHEYVYLLGLVGLFSYENLVHGFILHLDSKLPFLPLMLTSVYCSMGVTYIFLKYYLQFLRAN